MKITLIPGRELSDDLVRVWTGLLANPDLASPYFHPEFTKAIAAVRRDVEVAVLEADGKIAAGSRAAARIRRFWRPVRWP